MAGGAMEAVRRLRAGLRGWGGVGAMAVVCALTVIFALVLPLSGTRGGGP
ncbi:sugar-binding protein, partial [Streptomyces sp. JV178]